MASQLPRPKRVSPSRDERVVRGWGADEGVVYQEVVGVQVVVAVEVGFVLVVRGGCVVGLRIPRWRTKHRADQPGTTATDSAWKAQSNQRSVRQGDGEGCTE